MIAYSIRRIYSIILVLQELYNLQQTPQSTLSAECREFLGSALISRTELAIPLLSFIQHEEMEFQTNNLLLDAIDQSFQQKVSSYM